MRTDHDPRVRMNEWFTYYTALFSLYHVYIL